MNYRRLSRWIDASIFFCSLLACVSWLITVGLIAFTDYLPSRGMTGVMFALGAITALRWAVEAAEDWQRKKS